MEGVASAALVGARFEAGGGRDCLNRCECRRSADTMALDGTLMDRLSTGMRQICNQY